MENSKNWFHSDVNGLHLLFEWFPLDQNTNLWTGYLLIALVCASERGITYYLEHKDTIVESRLWTVLRRTLFYGLATTLRLVYMLVTMYFNTGLFIVVALSLTMSQFFIEVIRSGHYNQTTPLIKIKNNKKYNDLSSMDSQVEQDEEAHGEGSVRQYDIPKIVISNETEK